MAELAEVIPLKPEFAPEPADATEPAQLHDRIVFTLLVHGHGEVAPGPDGTPDYGDCVQCEQPWPWPQTLLAWRLREGF